MRAAIRAVVVIALALGVPIQGFAASSVACDPGRLPGGGAAHTAEGISRDSLTRPATHDHQHAGEGLAHDSSEHSKHEMPGKAQCKNRVHACCSAAIVSALPSIGVPLMHSVFACTEISLHDGLTPEVLERPPRPHLV
jgi:hypothetical protein